MAGYYFASIEDLSTCSTCLFLLILLYLLVVKVLKLLSSPEPPKLSYRQSSVACSSATDICEVPIKTSIEKLIESCSLLKQPYVPPWLWGRNGHVQTAIYWALGHRGLVRTADKRHYLTLPDTTTVTFDVFEPLDNHSQGDFTLALCPGIANSSESSYIRTCVHHAQEAGFRCAVLNHLGALKHEKLTSPRVFKYGSTEEYSVMIEKLCQLYPSTKFIVVGFSMGGNIVSKFLGEQPDAINRILLGVSVCQGYNAINTATYLHSWEHGRRIYEFIMAENTKRLLRNHHEDVVKPLVEQNVVDEQLIWSSTSFLALDEHYSRRMAGFKTLEAYYDWCSSINVLDQITIPTVFINAYDDPIMPPVLWQPVKKMAEWKPNFLFILTKHGGHLGFLEGHSFSPRSVTWLDRMIVQLSNCAVGAYAS